MKANSDHHNVVPFPRLSERLLDKGITALRDKKYKHAIELFEQLIQIEPNHPQGSYGLSVCYVELGLYDQAKHLTKEMMQRDIGNYFDVLKLHITVLIQLREYHEVHAIVDAVLSEKNVPTDIRQTLVQLDHFASQRANEPDLESVTDEAFPSMTEVTEEHLIQNGVPKHVLEEIEQGLNSDNYDHQWSAIRLAQEYKTALPSLKSFLVSSGNPILKSLVLQGLQDGGYKDSVEVLKFDKRYTVDLSQPLFYNEFSGSVTAILDDKLSSNNPTLLDVASQIWNHFVLLIFPLPLESNDPNLWASACYVYSTQISGMEDDEQTLESLFNTTSESVTPLVEYMRSIEEST